MKKERNIFMTKLWDTLKNKAKTIHELTKEFPNKTYKELEKYRDADRNEEAQQIFVEQENEELKWEQKYKKEHKLRQEAETETILVKGIGMNSPEMKAAKQKIEEMQKEIDRIKKENNDLYNRIAKLTDPAHTLKKARESGL
jgi:cell division protein FtsL